MNDLVDAKERWRIERDGLDETLFVEAGAGTGKTKELVDRVVNLVVERGVSLRKIAAITFTEAAAAELRDRVREAFEKRLADEGEGSSPSEEVRIACRQAMADIDQAAIGTLHGFCLRVLSEHPLEVGLPPRVEILDEVASQLAFEERWAGWVDRLYDDPGAEELVLRAWALGIEIDSAIKTKASFRDVASVFEDSWDRLGGLATATPPPLSPLDVRPIAEAAAGLRAIQGECRKPGDDKLWLDYERCIPEIEAALAEPDPLRQLRVIAERGPKWSSRVGQGPNWPDVAAARAALSEVGGRAGELLSRSIDEVLRQLSVRLAGFTVEAAEQRRAVGHLVFHDLLVLARRLLRTSGEARAALHDKYERLLLDEFQDTDPIQIEVAVLIASVIGGGREVVDDRWTEVDTEPGRLFFVGDPKQSIYRFRRADIGLFLEARDRFSSPGDGGGPVVLRQNFRTVEPVLSWVNGVFSSLMAEERPGQQPAYHPLHAHRSAEGSGADHRVVVLGGMRAGKAFEVRAEEAAAVAKTVASVMASPAAWPVAGDEPGTWRDPRWSDVTILIPTRTSLRQLEDALDHERVPYRVATGSLVFDTQEVREALDALRAVDDPGDELALVSALRSPLYACSDVDLFEWRAAGGRWDLRREYLPDGIGPDHPVAEAFAHLRSLSSARWWTEPSALLDRLLRERHAFALAFGARRPREVWRRLRFLVDQARAFEESATGSGGGGLRGFLAWAELQRTEGTRVHEPLMAETDDDAVSILTIHGAKGLEFPITVLSGMTTMVRGGRRGPEVHWDEHDVPEVRFNARSRTDNFDRLADIEAEMDEYERLRLLYVGCTRARDHLVVSAYHPDAKGTSYGKVLAANDVPEWSRRMFEEPGSVDVVVGPVAASPAVPSTPLTLPFDDRDGWIAARNALLAPFDEPRFVSATAIAAETASGSGIPPDAAGSRWQNPSGVDDVGEVGDGAPVVPWRRGRAGTAIGRAVHAVLQFATPESDDAELVALATRQAHVEAVPDDVETIVALARSALAAPSVQAGHAAARMWRELYVAAPIGTRAMEGYVDLLYEDDDGGLVLVDYKTDSVSGPAEVDAKVERYAIQTAAYALAIERSTGLEVREARLVFCKKGGAIERRIDDLPDRIAQVEQLLA